MAHWNYSLVSYDPANPGTFTPALTTALAKHPQYLVEAGLPLTASQLAMVKNAGAKWILDSVYPVTVSDPVLAVVDAYAQDALMGKIIADYFVSRLRRQGQRGDRARAGLSDPQRLHRRLRQGGQGAVPGAARPRSPTSRFRIWRPARCRARWCRRCRSNSVANYLVFDDGPFADGITSALVGGRSQRQGQGHRRGRRSGRHRRAEERDQRPRGPGSTLATRRY